MANPDDLVVGIDAGTGTVRAVLFTSSGHALASAGAPTPVVTTTNGGAEHPADALFRTLTMVMRKLSLETELFGRVRALAVAAFGETLIPVDGLGRPVAPGLAWYDPRPADAAVAIERLMSRDEIAAITGLRVEPTYGLAKIAWSRSSYPATARPGVCWLSVADWLAFCLSGVVATDPTMAGRTLALDMATQRWSERMLATVGLDARAMPPILPCGTRLGKLRPELVTEFGLPPTCVVAVGGYDRVLGALACDVASAGSLLDSLGTAEGLLLFHDGAIDPHASAAAGFNQGRTVGGPGAGSFLFGGLPTAGAALTWLERLLPGGAIDGLLRDAAALAPDAAGPLFLPTLRLASAPDPERIARGALLGIATDTSPVRLVRAVVEGLAMEAASVVDQMAALAGLQPPDRIVATGGGTRNALLMQLKAACFGQTIEVATTDETSALGAAICAAAGGGLFPGLAEAARAMGNHATTAVAPDPELQRFYRHRLRAVHVPLTRMLVHGVNPLVLAGSTAAQRIV